MLRQHAREDGGSRSKSACVARTSSESAARTESRHPGGMRALCRRRAGSYNPRASRHAGGGMTTGIALTAGAGPHPASAAASGATVPMAWNDPGRNRNPWGNRPDKGAADLDEALRQPAAQTVADVSAAAAATATAATMAGGGGSRGDARFRLRHRSAGAGRRSGPLTGFYRSTRRKRGVVTRFGKYVADDQPGSALAHPVAGRGAADRQCRDDRELQRPDPHAHLRREPRRPQSSPCSTGAPTRSQYSFNVRDPEETLGEVSESAIREIIGRSELDFVLERGPPGDHRAHQGTRAAHARRLQDGHRGHHRQPAGRERARSRCRPSQRDAIKAREDRERLGLEAQAYANDILPKARGFGGAPDRGCAGLQGAHRRRRRGRGRSGSSQLLDGYERAPGRHARSACTIETMEEVLGNTNKVLVDTKGAAAT